MDEQIITPSLNIWTSAFLLVSLIGLVLAFVLTSNKQKKRANWPIILLLIGFSFILIQYVFIWSEYRNIYPYVYLFDSSWYLIFGPLLYIYIARFYQKNFQINYVHFIPAFITFITSAYYLFQTNGYTFFDEVNSDPFYLVSRQFKFPWISIISLFVYYIFIKDFIQTFIQRNPDSEADQLRQTWTSYILNFYVLFILAYVSYYVLVQFPFFSPQWDYCISMTMALGIYGIGFMVYKESSIFNGTLLARLFLPKPENNGLSDHLKAALFNKLTSFMDSEKPYLDNELRLVHLADQLDFSSHLLSQLINEESGKNFNQFINDYRLDEATRLLEESNDLSIKRIYFEVGFNNKSTFYQSFKTKFGCTPNGYKKRQLADI